MSSFPSVAPGLAEGMPPVLEEQFIFQQYTEEEEEEEGTPQPQRQKSSGKKEGRGRGIKEKYKHLICGTKRKEGGKETRVTSSPLPHFPSIRIQFLSAALLFWPETPFLAFFCYPFIPSVAKTAFVPSFYSLGCGGGNLQNLAGFRIRNGKLRQCRVSVSPPCQDA